MYTIVEIQGKQFKVEKNQKLYVYRLNGVKGSSVVFDKILLINDNDVIKIGTPVINGVKVKARILQPLVKGNKILVFHKKRRKGYRKLNGHRQQFSQIIIKDILIS
ncbi:MAG: 50S ribosomal protein L21 [Bacteroidales bacterium OttesenSCG-928-I14]|jgi:large subunit ribosomal protein L21|nr:50S ribosomal protein L21 [Bacteroidales bacterium OttesenSCG-928-I14]